MNDNHHVETMALISETMPQAGWRCPRCDGMITYTKTGDLVRVEHRGLVESFYPAAGDALLEWLRRIH